MIITQQIINGVCSVTKTGSYFNLISAAGVVRVKLTKNGSTVLDSKMWVGMSLDKAQPFDEVEIYGEDGQIEFWAGDISMHLFQFSNEAARAIKTKKVILGDTATVLSNPNYLRKKIIVRPSEDILIGGSDGQAWRAPAGIETELPLAGSIYAYSRPPSITFVNEPQAQELEYFPDGNISNFIFKMDSGDFIFAGRGVQQGNKAIGFQEHKDFIGSYGKSFSSSIKFLGGRTSTGKIYIAEIPNLEGVITIYVSENNGIDFYKLTTLKSAEGDYLNVFTKTQKTIGNVLTLNYSEMNYIIDLDSGVSSQFKNDVDGVYFIAESFDKFYRLSQKQSIEMKLEVSYDSGSNWQTLADGIRDSTNGIRTHMISPDGKYAYCKDSASANGFYKFSNDLVNFVGLESLQYRPTYFGGGYWLVMSGGVTYLLTVTDGELVKNQISSDFVANESVLAIAKNGDISKVENTTLFELDTHVFGSLDAATVEVMELLA
ncbi:hypothetical protein [Shewanella algae]|uniref:hypothetical protein n=1 Tax=Shewanella algae TaxID=38313 RepID=UPI00313CD627